MAWTISGTRRGLVSNEGFISYAAGFFDGEGCVQIRVSYPRGTKSYSMRLQVSQVDVRPLEMLQQRWGGSLRLEPHRPRPIWRWCLQAHQAQAFLEEILPYLVVKRDQAEIAISFQRRRRKKSTSPKLRLASEPQNELDRVTLLEARKVA